MTRDEYIAAFEAAVARHPQGASLPKRNIHEPGDTVEVCAITMMAPGQWVFMGEPDAGWIFINRIHVKPQIIIEEVNKLDFDLMIETCLRQEGARAQETAPVTLDEAEETP